MPEKLYTYSDTKGELNAVSVPSNANFSAIVSFTNGIVDKLISSEDIGIISGDILKAYGTDNMFVLSSISSEFTMSPFYSQEVLSQINGATVTGDLATIEGVANTFDIRQTSDGLLYQGTVVAGKFTPLTFAVAGVPLTATTDYQSFNSNLIVVNHSHNDPTPDDNMVATRLSVTGVTTVSKPTEASVPELHFEATSFGTEIITKATIFNSFDDELPDPIYTVSFTTYRVANFEDSVPVEVAIALSMYTKFD